jgi:phenylpropionate dioxygenase-like ring-hydroxylating dioxygenase large terminal subunit
MAEALAWRTYSDPELTARERERIFARSWQYVGHLGELGDGPGYLATRVGDIPIVVTRDAEGTLRAFLNISSRPASVGVWGPFLFANPDPEASLLGDVLSGLPQLVADAGVDIHELRFHRRSESAVEANWKLVAENFLECYHCAVAHPGFSALVDVSPDAYRLVPGEAFSSQFGTVRENGGGLDIEGEVRRSQFHFLWPNTMINIFPGRTNLSIGPVLPAGPQRTERFLDYFFGPEADEEWIGELLEFDDQVGGEDKVLVENVQRGVATGLIDHGRLLPESERLIADFQQRIRTTLS